MEQSKLGLRVTRDDAYGEVGVINADTFISAGGTNSNNGSLYSMQEVVKGHASIQAVTS